MATNPDNLCMFRGRISSDIKPVKNKEGLVFAYEFNLEVKRNYRNRGKYVYDTSPMRVEREDLFAFVPGLKKGDEVSVVSSYTVKKLKSTEGRVFDKEFFLISGISKSGDGGSNESGGFTFEVDFPL